MMSEDDSSDEFQPSKIVISKTSKFFSTKNEAPPTSDQQFPSHNLEVSSDEGNADPSLSPNKQSALLSEEGKIKLNKFVYKNFNSITDYLINCLFKI